ncbi:MAG: hypothetical protein A2104_06390 [Candidatus Melainabacteria bacterium GWF2_32_7]|nr:MAG: hypothetical protein A2104_06390 [Candidatus Melainabacteria bacterium GWF2_32_7]
MQAVLTNPIKLIKSCADKSKKFPKDVIPYLLKASENADNKTRNDIENHIVKMGESAIPTLINALRNSKGTTRALIAMTLIRLGSASIEPLQVAYEKNLENQWIVNYIVSEIQGTQRPLSNVVNLKKVLVG